MQMEIDMDWIKTIDELPNDGQRVIAFVPMGMRFEEINPPKKDECPMPEPKKTTKQAKSSKVEKSTNS